MIVDQQILIKYFIMLSESKKMSGLSSISTKSNSKTSKENEKEANKSSAIKGSTEGTVSGPHSIPEVIFPSTDRSN